MFRQTFPVGPLQCNCTVLADEGTLEATVVDPGGDVGQILGLLAANRLRLTQIVVTHAHIDHIAGALELRERTGAPVLYNQRDLPLVAMMDVQAGWLGMATPRVAPPDNSAEDGLLLSIGHHRAEVIHTPGHTPGSISLYLSDDALLLAGDTLFRRSVGRTDLPGGDTATLLRSIRERLLHLPEGTTVVPGHGEHTTIGEEAERNPFLQNV